MFRRLVERVRELFAPLGGAEQDPQYVRPTVRKRGKTVDHPALVERAVTSRQLERWRNEGPLPRHPLGDSPSAGVRVDLVELDAWLASLIEPATTGPLADGSLGARDAVDRLLAAYDREPDRYGDAVREIAERVDVALWGER